MYRRAQLCTLLVGAVFCAACGESKDATPTSPELQIGSGPPCSPSTAKKFAKALAGTSSQIYDLAQKFTSQNANSVFATNLFFDLAAEGANLARPGTLTDVQKGNLANLLIQGIACANVVISDPDYSGLGYVDKFTQAAGSAGALEVRGLAVTEDPILSHNVGLHGSAGVKAPAAGFAAWYGGRVMFYGFPIDGFSHEAPPLTNRIAFEWFTVRPAGSLPSATLSGQVSICVSSPALVNASQLRIQHSATILPIATFQIDCDASTGSLFGSGGTQHESPMASAWAWLRQKLLPEPLHAASLLIATTPGGNARNLSPLEVVNPLGATLTYVAPPSDGAVDQGLGVTVHATGAALTDWEGLLIKLIAQDNNGRFVTVSPNTATTNASGIADFTNTTIDKPGVYKLVAVTLPSLDSDATGFVQDSVISGSFHRFPH